MLFSLTKKDFDVQFTRGSGNGGQNRNKVETACRIVHIESGAVGYSETHRTQLQNKKAAFERLVNSREFKDWHKAECARRLGKTVDMEEKVNEMMQDKYLKIEFLEDE